jgi:hypothetical protein
MKKLAALFTLLAVLTACGGGGGADDRPSTDDISKALKDKSNPNSVAIASQAPEESLDCIAKVLHDSSLSDGALKALVDGKANFEGDKDDTQAITDIADDLGKCVSG